jgi:hypothetical protein
MCGHVGGTCGLQGLEQVAERWAVHMLPVPFTGLHQQDTFTGLHQQDTFTGLHQQDTLHAPHPPGTPCCCCCIHHLMHGTASVAYPQRPSPSSTS